MTTRRGGPDGKERSDLERLIRRIGSLWWAYLTGQMLLALITGSMVWAMGIAVGLSWPLALGLITGILSVIPTLGSIIAAVPAVIVALWRGSSTIPVPNWAFALIVLALFVVIQQIESLLLAPRILGERLGLSPLLVLAAVIVGTLVANVVGAYLAIPLLVAAREVVDYAQRKAQGLPPFPEDNAGPTDDTPPP